MAILNPRSLSDTLDRVNEAFFFQRTLSRADRQAAADWIASRQGLAGSYGGMFAPTARDFDGGIRVFTGESAGSRAGVAHVLGEEACRALRLLNAGRRDIRDALVRAGEGMTQRMRDSLYKPRNKQFRGEYCCAKCTVSVWRQVVVGGLGEIDRDELLSAGLRCLRAGREGNGRWRRYPYYYTLLALSEMDGRQARDEIRYASPGLEKLLKRKVKPADKYDLRRRTLAQRVLGLA